MTKISTASAALAALLFTGCATTGATWRSGVADTFFDAPPYYAGAGVIQRGPIGHLPITFQRGATQPGTFDPADTPIGGLLAEMNAYLDALGVTLRLAAAAPSTGPTHAAPTPAATGVATTGTALTAGSAIGIAPGVPPDVHFGCERLPHDDCENIDDRRPYRLAVGRPSSSWVEWAAGVARVGDAERVLVLTLEVGNYVAQQRNWRGSKEVRLGTGYTVDVPWLTALDRPAAVLQLTGALIDTDGRAVRIGAEGLIVRRTNVLLGGFGIQALISDEDIERARTLRREDLPGQPLVWQVALDSMVAQLTGTRVAAR
jgi:hypothetical protein